MKALRLCPLTPDDLGEVAHIKVAPAHQKFSGTVTEAFEAAEAQVDFYGIYFAQTAVGFFKVDRGYPDRYPFAPAGDLGLRAFIIDADHHGQGIARRAVRAFPAYLPTFYPKAQAIYLTVNKINPAVIKAYLNGGFEDTHTEWPYGDAGPQHIMRLAL